MAYYLIFGTFKLDMNTFYHTTTKVGVTFPVLVYASETTFRCNVVLFFTAVFFVSNQIRLRALLNFIMMSRYKPLHDAVRENRKDVVKHLLNNGVDVNAQDDRGTTALHIAAENGKLDIVELLLMFGANVDIEGKYGNIPLHVCCTNGSKEITLTLLNNGSDVNTKNRYGESPLHIAVKYTNKGIVEILLNKGAQLDTQDFYGDTVLHSCVRENCREILEVLLEYGADVKTSNKEDYTAFDVALQRNEADMIHLLLPHHFFGKSPINDVNEFLDSFRVKKDIKTLLHKNIEELQYMKTCKVSETKYSFRDFLTKNPRQIEKCVGNEIFEESLNSNDSNVKFPIYIGMIRRNFDKAVRRRQLLEKCYKEFSSVLNLYLPLLCLELVFENFTDYELENFRIR